MRISTVHICSAIVAATFLFVAGLATAEDTKPKSNEPSDADIPKESIERVQKERAALEKAGDKHKKEISDLRDKERAAQLENLRKEREQREAKEKADNDKANKVKGEKDQGKDKPSDT